MSDPNMIEVCVKTLGSYRQCNKCGMAKSISAGRSMPSAVCCGQLATAILDDYSWRRLCPWLRQIVKNRPTDYTF